MAQTKKRAAAPATKKKNEKPSPGVKKVTIAEQGKKLPIGSLVGGSLVKDLSTRPWKTRDDRELGKERKKDTTASKYIGMILKRMCPVLADYKQSDFGKEEDLEKALAKIGQLYAGDVFFAYIQVRIEAIGSELPMQVACGACGHGFKFVGQLDTVDCHVVEDPRDLYWEFPLRDGAEIRGKTVNKFRMGPTRWNLMDEAQRVGRSGNTVDVAAIKLATARNSIFSLDDDPSQILLAEVELDDMSKFDQENLMNEINEHSLGPQLVIEGECPECRAEFMKAIDWESNDFFAISSQS